MSLRVFHHACFSVIWLIVCLAPPVRGSEETTEVAPGSSVTISDRFFSDSLKDYHLAGPVKWELGKLTLPASSGIFRQEPLLADLKIEVHIWPVLGEGDQATSVSRISIPASNGWEIIIAIARQRHQGQLHRQLVFAEANRGGSGDRAGHTEESSELRHSSPFTISGDIERWTITYNNGLIKVSCNGTLVGQAYSAAFASWCQGVVVQQISGTCELTQLSITGKRSGYTAEQRKAYEETVRLRLKAEEALTQGDLYGAIQIEQSKIPIMEKAFGKDFYALGLVYQWIGMRLTEAGHSAEAKEAMERAAKAFQSSLGRFHPETVLTYTMVGQEMAKAGDLGEAEKIIRPALKRFLEIAGPGSSRTKAVITEYCNVLVERSDELVDEEHYEQAARYLRERYQLERSTQDPDAWDVLRAKRDYEFVDYLTSADLSTQQQIKKWTQRVEAINRYITEGQNTAALAALKQSLDDAQKLFGEDHLRTIQTMEALARSAANGGDPGLSISLCEKVLEYWRRNGEENDYALVDAIVALAGMYSVADRHAEAENLFQEAASICRRAEQESSNSFAICMMEWGRNQIRMGDNRAARESLKHALQVFTDKSDPAGVSALKTRERLADICRAEGDLAGAQFYLDQQRALVLERYGKTSVPYIEVVLSEAMQLLMQSRFSESVALYEEALALAEQGSGKESSLYQTALQGLIKARSWQGNDSDAIRRFLEYVDLQQKRRESLFNAYPERLQFSRVLMDRNLLSSVLQLSSARQIDAVAAYERVLSAKGAVTTRQRALHVAAQDAKLRDLVTELRKVNSDVSKALVKPLSQEQQAETKALLQRKDRLESQLAQRSKSENASHWQVDVRDLQDCLPEGVALVDYIEYQRLPNFVERLLGKTGVLAMAAFVVTNDREIKFIELGDVEPIDTAIVEWLAAIQAEPLIASENDAPAMAEIVDSRGSLVRKLIWDPLTQSLGKYQTIIVSPDGMLVACPFAALPLEGNKGVLINEKAIVNTIAARLLPELLKRDASVEIAKPRLLAVDGVDYGQSHDTDEEVADWTAVPFLPVPLDEEGTQLIRDGFRHRFKDGKSGQLTGNEAQEDSFKKVAEKAHFIHLVTHGFCLHASEIHMSPPEIRTEDGTVLDATSDPVVAGIAFAGANAGLSGTDDDGILWTDEISSLDLHQAELVVIFACESTLGSYAPGEGMLGCQRAFQVAGARASIGTLWSIEVDATREFMKQFYHNYWDRRLSKSEALRAAMMHLMWQYPKSRTSLDDSEPALRCPPALWAGFVLTGDWR